MAGLRYYIHNKQFKDLDRESKNLGIEINDLISMKLKRELLEGSPDSKLSRRLEKCEILLSQLSEDLSLIRNAINNDWRQ